MAGYRFFDAVPTERRVLLFYFFHTKMKGSQKMKTAIRKITALTLIVLTVLALAACFNTVDAEGLWENATYRRDMEFGKGERVVTVVVAAGESSVTFTINTDKETVGAALLEHQLIAGEDGAYGLYVKTVNGILADYDVDQSYWAFYINGEYAMTGVDTTPITDGEIYKLEYTK